MDLLSAQIPLPWLIATWSTAAGLLGLIALRAAWFRLKDSADPNVFLGACVAVLTAFSIPSAGVSFLSLGLVDMRTGDVLWLSADSKGGAINLRNEKDLKTVLTELFASYPSLPKAADGKKPK